MKIILVFAFCFFFGFSSKAQYANLLANAHGRQHISLDGKWEIIVDPFNSGAGGKPVWKDQKPFGKYDFYEYGFIPSVTLNVPGDWNHQKPELLYY
ncbi:MAG TPA: hypothetical protein VFI29_14925, partial [Hanamia sp.]|nr:hypothetical protein [Hanamia sp.]